MTIYRSRVPDQPVPKTNAYTFAVSNPNKTPDSYPVIVDAQTKQIITYGEWKRDTRRLATGLQRKLGFKRGDVLALFSFNQVDYSVALFAPLILGAITTTVNSAYTAQELAYQLKDAGASTMVAHPELLSVAIEGASMVGMPRERIFLFGTEAKDGFLPYSTLMPSLDQSREGQLVEVLEMDEQTAKTTTALICYSSGTTGKSKGVELSHTNVAVNAVQVVSFDGPVHPHDNVVLSVLPMYHLYSLQLHLVCGIYTGTQSIVLQKFNFEEFLRAIQEFKIKTLNLVPPQVLLMVKSPLVDQYDLSSVIQMNVGAAPISKELIEAILAKYSLAIRQAYGMSELSPGSHLGRYDKMVHGSAGLVLPNQEVRLVDPETGRDAAPGERGEIWVRGPNVMLGYRNNPEATRATIDPEGWLHTGDIGVVDAEENFFIVDRMKELIKYKGFQVAPAELEAILLTHAEILDTAVIGVDDPEQAIEVPLAFVVKSADSGLTAEQVVSFVSSKVAPHKKLRGGVRFIDAIPKSAAGKILRKDLRAVLQRDPQPVKAKL
ncbi:4-coumarate--CoA ligase [Entomortierella parvispora]|uniref:4-coumarate--CoA ligase n=1 Tax=Entomortierella parvispora TaxID=205924 RepID=A0A9P3H296_9FUNG|nr:4-coumarate--CoA ligase [Entomortierella parvispora]